MSHVPRRGIRGLVSAFARCFALPRVSLPLALGGLLLAAPGMAQTKPVTQATIANVTVEEGALTARILWPDTPNLPTSARVASYNGRGEVTVRVDVAPRANTQVVVRLPGALAKPWETGWSQKLILEDGGGQALATQPYDVSLDCDGNGDEERCGLVVYPSIGIGNGVLHLSEALDQAIEAQRPPDGKEFDLVASISAAYPELRGEALVLGDQIAKLRRPGPCTCNWAAVIQRNPAWAQSKYSTGYLTQMLGHNGAGATHFLHAKAFGQLFSSVHEISDTASGSSQVTLKVSCSQLLYYIDKWVIIFRPDGTWEVVHIQMPVYGSCPPPCGVTLDNMCRYTGQTYVNALQQPSNRAYATESGTCSVNSTTLINQSTGAGGGFDNTSGLTVGSASSTTKVQASGYARAVGRWYSADGWVRNGYAIAIHGKAACVFPNEAAVWDYGTSQGTAHQNSLKGSIQSFFWQWNIPVNP